MEGSWALRIISNLGTKTGRDIKLQNFPSTLLPL